MSYCLYCHQSFTDSWSWALLLGIANEELLCQPCKGKLEPIKGEICRICGRPLSLFPEQYRQGDCCYDCIRWEADEEWSGVLVKNRSLYVYNDFLKEVVAKLKYRGDAELIKAFSPKVRGFVKREYKGRLLVPIPLSDERHYERGFNQAAIFAGEIGFVNHLLKRVTHEEKQSKKDRRERMMNKVNPFEVMDTENAKGKRVVLVDDVYTTGATLRHAAKILLEAGAKNVCSITLGR